MIRSSAEIYQVLEKHLRKAGEKPQTCVDLYEHRDVKELVESANRVSDYLGHMWRRGLLQRWYAANTTQRSRYAYTWIGDKEEEAKPVHYLTVAEGKKPNATVVEEDGKLVIDFESFTITIQSK